MPLALHKVQKKISKKKGGKPTALHENSRDARRLRQAGAREDKIAKIMTAASHSNRVYVERVSWFKERVGDREDLLSDLEMQQMVEEYIGREDEELAELKAAHRPGRPRAKAEERIQDRLDAEQREFKSGFWAPDLRNEDCFNKIKRWGGRWGGLSTLTYVRVAQEMEIKPSAFPPKSLS